MRPTRWPFAAKAAANCDRLCRSSAAATSDRRAHSDRPAPASRPGESRPSSPAVCTRRRAAAPGRHLACPRLPIPSGHDRLCWPQCRSPPTPPRCRRIRPPEPRSPPINGDRVHSDAGTARRSARESHWNRSSKSSSQFRPRRESAAVANHPARDSVISGRPRRLRHEQTSTNQTSAPVPLIVALHRARSWRSSDGAAGEWL